MEKDVEVTHYKHKVKCHQLHVREGSLHPHVSIWGFDTLLKGTLAVLWRCPGTALSNQQ